jgi:hypothetical protein
MRTKAVSKVQLPGPSPVAGDYGNSALEDAMFQYGPDTVRELVHRLRAIRYGSIVLIRHEGQSVEMTKW